MGTDHLSATATANMPADTVRMVLNSAAAAIVAVAESKAPPPPTANTSAAHIHRVGKDKSLTFNSRERLGASGRWWFTNRSTTPCSVRMVPEHPSFVSLAGDV